MKKYMVFGFTNLEYFNIAEEPSKEERQLIMDEWKSWMVEMGDLLLDMGSPLINGNQLSSKGLEGESRSNLAGYMKIQANDLEHAVELLNKSPLFKNGHAQKYEIFECIM